MSKHRWGEKVVFPHKSECECLKGCRTIKVARHENEGGHDVYWTEFWRDGEKIDCAGTPACEPVAAEMEAGT
jgi:hypothetical protein